MLGIRVLVSSVVVSVLFRAITSNRSVLVVLVIERKVVDDLVEPFVSVTFARIDRHDSRMILVITFKLVIGRVNAEKQK